MAALKAATEVELKYLPLKLFLLEYARESCMFLARSEEAHCHKIASLWFERLDPCAHEIVGIPSRFLDLGLRQQSVHGLKIDPGRCQSLNARAISLFLALL